MWYYTINNQKLGPIDEALLIQMANAGQVPVDVPVWTQGMATWVKLNQTTLASRLHTPPPTPGQTPAATFPPPATDQKDRVAYVLLAVLLGIGVHNLYAGYITRGIIQLVAVIGSCLILWIPVWIWSVIEAIVILEDAKGVRFK